MQNLSAVRTIDASNVRFCAIAGPARSVRCWGDDSSGGLGDGPPHDGTFSSVVVDTNVTSAEEVHTGWASTCARLTGGDVFCWGNNYKGQHGIGNTDPTNAKTTRTLLDAGAVGMSFRWASGCALLTTGRAQCWGENFFGIIGNGTVHVDAITPEFVLW